MNKLIKNKRYICEDCGWKKIGKYCERWPKSKGNWVIPPTAPYEETTWCSEYKPKKK